MILVPEFPVLLTDEIAEREGNTRMEKKVSLHETPSHSEQNRQNATQGDQDCDRFFPPNEKRFKHS
jgi:hypothetical protein